MGILELSRRLARKGSLCLVGVVFAAIGWSATAFAAEGRTFDPVLSLTGGCKTDGVDPVADPGCPSLKPPQPFSVPMSVIADSHGNIFVASLGKGEGAEGRIDIFNSEGVYIEDSQLAVPAGPMNLAVDSEGYLYVYTLKRDLRRYDPSVYEPAEGKIKYKSEPAILTEGSFSNFVGLEVTPDDHLFVQNSQYITEYGPAAAANKFISADIGKGTLDNSHGLGLAIDATRKRVYASNRITTPEGLRAVVSVFDLEAPHALLGTIDGASVPPGRFLSNFLALAVDESTGNLFVYDGNGAEVVYELSEDGEYLASIDHELNKHWVFGAEISVDNGKNSPNGALNPFGRYLYVPAFPQGIGHAFAFSPPDSCAAEIDSISFRDATEDEVELKGQVQPCFLQTTYRFEYTTLQSYEEEGFAGAAVAEEGSIPAGGSPVDVAAVAEGLTPGTTYRFRLVVENEEGGEEAEGEFATYPFQPISPCANDPLRTGLSALLPDCRAYELVTPANTNARAPMGLGHFGVYFGSRQVAPAGDKVSFQIEGGLIPGSEGTGSLGGDPYLATRGDDGWDTVQAGPSGAEATELLPGSTSPDQGYSFWSTAGGSGSAAVEGGATSYVHYPDGHSALVGRGSIATDPRATGMLISDGGGHIVFVSGPNSSAVQLEPNAPPSGTWAVYDRTSDEITHVVSLLPGDKAPAAGENALYQGASLGGEGIAFSIGKTLYLRYDNEATYEIGESITFAGVAEGGDRIFYVEGGNLYAFDVNGEETIQFTSSNDVEPVNVAADGTTAYFISPSVLTGEANPLGHLPKAAGQNLYRSDEGSIEFVGTVTKRDVEGETTPTGPVEGLGLWTAVVGPSLGPPGRFAADPSRSTPDGGVLLFESRANLTDYDSEGHAQVYRYSVAGELDCLSCNPTLTSPTGDASLQSISPERFKPEPLNPYAVVDNLRGDGQRAVFQSEDPLVPGDTDGLQDVYEWEAQGVGSCANPSGCVYLISSGHSDRIDYLYAVSDSGNDIFFRSSDLLLGIDSDETPSIYDARVGGGFPEEEGTICQGEGCRPTMPPPPVLPPSESRARGPEVPPVTKKPCPKGKRKVKRHGKVRCVKKKHHKPRRHKPGSSKKGGGK